jgi:hypothetical protein
MSMLLPNLRFAWTLNLVPSLLPILFPVQIWLAKFEQGTKFGGSFVNKFGGG